MRSLARFTVAIIIGISFHVFLTCLVSQAQVVSDHRVALPERCSAHLEEGQLSVTAERCTLRDILDSICNATGATIEWSGVDGEEPGVVFTGPGDPAPVVSAILYGTPWNFIITSDSSGLIKHIILAPRPELPVVVADHAAKDGRQPSSVTTTAAATKKEKSISDTVAKDLHKELPPNISKDMYKLYPSLFPDFAPAVVASTGASQKTSSSGSSFAAPGGQGSTIPNTVQPVGHLALDSNGRPILPPNINPAIWNIYPPNLMQLVTGTRPAPPPFTPSATSTLLNILSGSPKSP
jgi:hypothetical protein